MTRSTPHGRSPTKNDEPEDENEDEEESSTAAHVRYLTAQLEVLEDVYEKMQSLHITSISKLETKISQIREEIKKTTA